MKNKKWMNTLLGGALATLGYAQNLQAAPAEYFRVWEGHKRAELSDAVFKQMLGGFMDDTRALYEGRGLSEYIVLIPPKNKPASMPDEFALVALESEAQYRSIRQTPAGQAYSQRHWDIFDQSTSKSASKFIRYFEQLPNSLESGAAYDLIGENIDWSKGYTMAFIGMRPTHVSPSDFLQSLSNHVRLAAENLKVHGMQGYIVLANKDYEVAYINWPSRIHHDRAFEIRAGQEVFEDASKFMTPLMYENVARRARGSLPNDNGAYASLKSPKALITVTSHAKLGNTGKKTGYYLSELAHPYLELEKAGFEIEIASPQGGLAPVDPTSLQLEDTELRNFWSRQDIQDRLQRTLPLAKAKASDYNSILFAGGHGTMWDFPVNTSLQNLSRDIFENGGIVAAVCHGPAALVNIQLSNGRYLVDGKAVTGFSNPEEDAVGLTQVMPFSLEDALKYRGAKYQAKDLWQANVLEDGRLITGQNPASAKEVGTTLVNALLTNQ